MPSEYTEAHQVSTSPTLCSWTEVQLHLCPQKCYTKAVAAQLKAATMKGYLEGVGVCTSKLLPSHPHQVFSYKPKCTQHIFSINIFIFSEQAPGNIMSTSITHYETILFKTVRANLSCTSITPYIKSTTDIIYIIQSPSQSHTGLLANSTDRYTIPQTLDWE